MHEQPSASANRAKHRKKNSQKTENGKKRKKRSDVHTLNWNGKRRKVVKSVRSCFFASPKHSIHSLLEPQRQLQNERQHAVMFIVYTIDAVAAAAVLAYTWLHLNWRMQFVIVVALASHYQTSSNAWFTWFLSNTFFFVAVGSYLLNFEWARWTKHANFRCQPRKWPRNTIWFCIYFVAFCKC